MSSTPSPTPPGAPFPGAIPLHNAVVGSVASSTGSATQRYSPGQIWVARKGQPAGPAAGAAAAPAGLRVEAARADDPQVLALIQALDDYQRPLYPAASASLPDIEALLQPQVRLLVVRNAQQQVLGCGAIVLEEDYAELKWMMVAPARRGEGLATKLLSGLERLAVQAGRPLLRLETGVRQPAALHFYERMGFERCGPFGRYRADPFSIFMEKLLGG